MLVRPILFAAATLFSCCPAFASAPFIADGPLSGLGPAAASSAYPSSPGTPAANPAPPEDRLTAAIIRAAEAPITDVERRVREARFLLDTGRLDEALSSANALILASPQNAAAFNILGRVHLVRGSMPEAQLAFAEAARLDPSNTEAAAIAGSLVRKAGLKAYVEGIDAFNRKAWKRAAVLLKQALQMGNLPAEHSAIAQQDLIIAEFSATRVTEEIRAIQQARVDASRAYLARRITPVDAASYPATNGPGNAVNFVGRIVDRRDDPRTSTSQLVVTMRQSSYDYRDESLGSGYFSVFTRGPLPHDARATRGALVEVRGHIIEANGAYGASAPRTAVLADYLDFSQDSNRGLAGPLRVNYLRFNDEQRQNLPPGSR